MRFKIDIDKSSSKSCQRQGEHFPIFGQFRFWYFPHNFNCPTSVPPSKKFSIKDGCDFFQSFLTINCQQDMGLHFGTTTDMIREFLFSLGGKKSFSDNRDFGIFHKFPRAIKRISLTSNFFYHNYVSKIDLLRL